MSENMSAIAADSFPNIYLPRVVLDKIDIPENSIIISTIIEDPSLSDGSTAQSSDFNDNRYNEVDSEVEVSYRIHSIEYICQDCYKSFNTAELHKKHVLTCHTEGNRLLNIPIEYLPFVRLNRIDIPDKKTKTEIDTESHKESKTHKSEISSKGKNKFNLTKKKEKHGPAPRKIYQCEKCGYVFNKKYNLQQHILLHTGKRPHQCPHCPSAFRNPSNLKSHIKSIHTNERPHKCPYCPRAFVISHNLKSHIASIHSKKRPFKCNDCDAKFSQSRQLNDHKFKCHQIRTSDNKKLKCLYCHLGFTEQYYLTAHLNTHRHGKDWKCNQCSYMTNYSSSLKKHITKHFN
ncbi:hypothetical protein KQX54_016139 [Cotesia glomerata]|nr:hypothetical protein KQX54_016139 [Cotesia glomerata]